VGAESPVAVDVGSLPRNEDVQEAVGQNASASTSITVGRVSHHAAAVTGADGKTCPC